MHCEIAEVELQTIRVESFSQGSKQALLCSLMIAKAKNSNLLLRNSHNLNVGFIYRYAVFISILLYHFSHVIMIFLFCFLDYHFVISIFT